MPERDKVQSVIDGWLKIATDGLGVEARERIRAEIETHGRDTFEGLESNGYSQPAALQTLWLSLGDPRIARRSLRRVYLTEAQENYLSQLLRPRRWRVLEFWICALAFGGPALYCAFFMDQLAPILTILTVFMLMILMHRISWRIFLHQPPRRQIDLLILFDVLGFMLYTFIFTALWINYRNEIPLLWFYLAITLNSLGPLVRILPIRIKLGKGEPPNRNA